MAQVTHAQIAKIARLSRSTVSRALQNHPAIPEKTRQRVQKLAEKLGYRPNPLISALMASRRKPAPPASAIPIAMLTAWPFSCDVAKAAPIQRLLRGAAERALELGYHLEEFWINEPGVTHERLSQILINRGVVAILLAPLPDNHAEIQLDWNHFSVAAFAPSANFPLFHRASHFQFGGACLALEEVHRLGYRRPGLVLSTRAAQHIRDQYLGGMAAIEKRGIFQGKIPWLVLAEENPEALRAWLKRHEPDVIVGDDSRTVEWLKKIGNAIPRKMAFAHLDRPPGNEFGGVDQIRELIGRSAIDLIVAQIYRNERGIPPYAKDTQLTGVWVNGQSVPSRI